jgi:hypothetical protein
MIELRWTRHCGWSGERIHLVGGRLVGNELDLKSVQLFFQKVGEEFGLGIVHSSLLRSIKYHEVVPFGKRGSQPLPLWWHS